MSQKLKLLLFVETVAILVLVGLLAANKDGVPAPKSGLLSPLIYANADPSVPKGFAIQDMFPLQLRLAKFISDNNFNVSIYLMNLKTGASMYVNEEGFYAASLNKIPVAILVMEHVESGKLAMDSKLKILDSDRDQSSGLSSKELTVRELLEAMLKESDNTAFNVLFRQIDTQDMTLLLDYYNIDYNSNYQFTPYSAGFKNQSEFMTPRVVSNVFSSLYFSTVLHPEDSEYILSLLTESDFNVTKIAALPDNVKIAHKYGIYYGTDAKLFHDCGIIYMASTRFFYCVMTSGMELTKAETVSILIVKETYSYIVQTRAKFDAYKEHFSKDDI